MKQWTLSYVKITYSEWRIQQCIWLVTWLCGYSVVMNIPMVYLYMYFKIFVIYNLLNFYSRLYLWVLPLCALLARFTDEYVVSFHLNYCSWYFFGCFYNRWLLFMMVKWLLSYCTFINWFFTYTYSDLYIVSIHLNYCSLYANLLFSPGLISLYGCEIDYYLLSSS